MGRRYIPTGMGKEQEYRHGVRMTMGASNRQSVAEHGLECSGRRHFEVPVTEESPSRSARRRLTMPTGAQEKPQHKRVMQQKYDNHGLMEGDGVMRANKKTGFMMTIDAPRCKVARISHKSAHDTNALSMSLTTVQPGTSRNPIVPSPPTPRVATRFKPHHSDPFAKDRALIGGNPTKRKVAQASDRMTIEQREALGKPKGLRHIATPRAGAPKQQNRAMHAKSHKSHIKPNNNIVPSSYCPTTTSVAHRRAVRSDIRMAHWRKHTQSHVLQPDMLKATVSRRGLCAPPQSQRKTLEGVWSSPKFGLHRNGALRLTAGPTAPVGMLQDGSARRASRPMIKA